MTVVSAVFSLTVSADSWEITSRLSLEGNVLKAELYNGVMRLKVVNANDGKASAALMDFAGSDIQWKSPADYMKISEVYFGTGIKSLEGVDMLRLGNAAVIHIPSSVTNIGQVGKTLKLKKIYYGGNEKQWNALVGTDI